MMMPAEDSIAVWIVEDETKYRETICTVLEHTEGLQCAEAFPDCEAALDWLKIAPVEQVPDIILLDINLPGLSGIEGIGRMKALVPQTHIVMLTILDAADTIYDAFRAGASGYLLKNTPLRGIVAAVREASQGGMLMPPDVAGKVLDFFTKPGPKVDYGLTRREKEVLQEMAEGYTQKEIAARLFVAANTINTHIQHIYEKLHVHSNVEAVAKAFRERLI